MFCPNCGNQCPDGTKFCQSCGSPLANNQQQNQNAQPDSGNQQANYQQPYQQYQQPNYNQYQQPNYNQPYQQPYQQYPQYPDPYNGHPMGWYKFLIYFALFAGAVLNVLSAFTYFTGTVYTVNDIDPLAVYALYPSAKIVDIIYGIALLAMAAFMIVTRFQLSGMKKNGPKMVVSLYIINIALAIIYTVALMFVTNIFEFDATTAGQCVVPIVMAIVNKVYFDRRKDLFVN